VRQAASSALLGIRIRIREHRVLVALAATVATLVVLAVVILPLLLAGGDDTENDVRSTLLQGLAGLFLGAGLYFTAQTLRHNRESAARTFELEREGQITERFTRAIDQLGNEKLDVRLGGIYALERIAKSSTEDHGSIMEVLTAYVREHAPWPRREADESEEAVFAEHREHDEDREPATDVQAVIAVLGRRELGRREHALDLSSVDLRRARFGKGADEGHFEVAKFVGAQLERADLDGAHLTVADFRGANLTGAKLMRANLTKAHLEGANLTGAMVVGANLWGAKLNGANLTKAYLAGANLEGADLYGAVLMGGADLRGAHLVGADLRGAKFAGADLEGAHLAGADLEGADLEGADLAGAVYDAATRWPAGFDPKAEGARLSEEDSELASDG
jgi:uncharacterized protein YjbI with pentapeptide repeats